MPLLRRVFGMLIFISTVFGAAQGQAPEALVFLSGVVVDPSGARISSASLHVHSDSVDEDSTASAGGSFSLALPPGSYTLTVDAPGFRTLSDSIVLDRKNQQDLIFRLSIAARPEEVSVNPWAGSTDPADNRNALTFSGSQLQVLSEDPVILREQLLAMAGGGAGAGGAQFYIDGFSNGQLPPKAAIRSVRINSNPYSAEFDHAGFGRVNIETRAGGERLHGIFDIAGTDAALNARNPYTGEQPSYHQLFFDGNLNGPLGKKITFFLAGNSTDLQNNAIVNAVNPDQPSSTLSEAVPNPQRDDDYSLRLDRQFSAENSLNGRYEIHRTGLVNGGVGLLVLPSEGYNSNSVIQTLQIDDNNVIDSKIVSDTRFQYIRTRLRQDPNDTSPTVIVEGAFSGGGSPAQALRDNQDHYELQEDLSMDRGAHFVRTGARYRLYRDSSYSSGGFNGQFTFPDIAAYENGKPTQFSLLAGSRSGSVATGDFSVYAADDWKLTRSFTLSLGLRFETQTGVADHTDPAPRLGFAWAIGPRTAKAPILTLRGGAGIFYQHFAVVNLLQAARQNGVSQTGYFVQNPAFYPAVPAASSLSSSQPTRYRVDPHLRTSYEFISSLAVERMLGNLGNVTATYLNVHGAHQYVSINANAPLPGTYDPAVPNSGMRPMGGDQNIYEYTSQGESNAHVLFSNLNLQPTRHLYVWAFYVAEQYRSDTDGASTFASNSYDVRQDYGRDTTTAGQEMFCGFAWKLPYGLSLQPFLNARGGRPFNITTGSDLNGDTIYNDRPAFAGDVTGASVVHTPLGSFDTDPLPTERRIPYNYGRAPGLVWLDLQVGESVHVGPRPKAVAGASEDGAAKPAVALERPWQISLKLEVENLLNHDNPGPPVGVLNSPFFGRSLSLANDFSSLTAANRVVMLHSSFSF